MYRKLRVENYGYVVADLTRQEFNELVHLKPNANYDNSFHRAGLILRKLGYFPGSSDYWHWPPGSYTPITALTTRELHKILKPKKRWR